MPKPFVSVIVPVYNAEAYLGECLSSLRSQTYENFEIILVDDGSTDRSPAIIHSFQNMDARVQSVRIENSGPSRARNVGMEMAKGKYVCFVDADDFVAPQFLKVLTETVEDADICVAAKRRWNQPLNLSRYDRCPDFRGDRAALKKRLFRYRRILRGTTGRLYRTSLIRAYDLQFDEAMRYGEDMTFNYLVFRYASEVVFVNRVLYTYRIDNPNSLSRIDRTSIARQRAMQNACIRDTFGDA